MPLTISTPSTNILRTTAAGILCLLVINTTHAQKQLQAPQVLYKGDGVIVYVDKRGGETELSKAAVDSTPILYDNHILMVESVEHTDDKSGISSWDIKTKTKKVLVAPRMKADADYVITDKIVHMVAEKRSKRLFFSTYSTKTSEYMTWTYDFVTGNIHSFKDGLIKEVDAAGNATLVFYGTDYKGAYTQQISYAGNGALLNMQDKQR